MASYTPGPWEVTDIPQGARTSKLSIKAAFGYPGMDDSQLVPALITFGKNAEGNARLIAALPDLLAVCKAVRDLLGHDPGKDRPGEMPAMGKVRRMANAAYAKANRD